MADLLEVVVFATGANAFLGRNGFVVIPMFEPLEDAFELDHPGVGKKKGRVVGGD